MKVGTLDNIEFEEIIECFLSAFANYYVKMPSDPAFYKKKWESAKVDYKFSYGMFDNGKLVGFVIHAIDKHKGFPTAFNTGTGVMPEYRGRRITKRIYDHAVPKLRLKGIEKCLLEVITENRTAIRCYKNIGFDMIRTMKCFKGRFEVPISDINMVEKKLSSAVFGNFPNQGYYSWDNRKEMLENNKDLRYFHLEDQGEIDSYFIIDPKNGYLAQFESVPNNPQNWKRLFSAIRNVCENTKINNVDTQLKEKIAFLKAIGLNNTVDQYEMEMSLDILS